VTKKHGPKFGEANCSEQGPVVGGKFQPQGSKLLAGNAHISPTHLPSLSQKEPRSMARTEKCMPLANTISISEFSRENKIITQCGIDCSLNRSYAQMEYHCLNIESPWHVIARGWFCLNLHLMFSLDGKKHVFLFAWQMMLKQ